jgi:hypothetical protein
MFSVSCDWITIVVLAKKMANFECLTRFHVIKAHIFNFLVRRKFGIGGFFCRESTQAVSESMQSTFRFDKTSINSSKDMMKFCSQQTTCMIN